MAIKIKTGEKVNTKITLTGEGVPYDLKVKLPSKSGRLALVEDFAILLGLNGFNLEADNLVTKVELPWDAPSEQIRNTNLAIVGGSYFGAWTVYFGGFRSEEEKQESIDRGDLIRNPNELEVIQNTGISIASSIYQYVREPLFPIEESVLKNTNLSITGGIYEGTLTHDFYVEEKDRLLNKNLSIETGQYDQILILPERYSDSISNTSLNIIDGIYEEE